MSKQQTNEELFLEAWSQFNEQIKTDEDAADVIFQSLLQDNKIICGCNNPQILHESGERYFRCLSCKRKVRFTAGTLFANTSRPRAWLAAVCFHERGVTVSSLRLSRLLDIAQSTALNINKKVSIAIVSQMDASAQTVDARHFTEVIFRRSRHTPADQHPRSELPNGPGSLPDSDVEPDIDPNAEPESATTNDPRGKKEPTKHSLAGMKYQLTMTMIIAAAITFIRKYFHGVSHKYLQLYLAPLWCHLDRETWSEGTVLRACLRHPPISYIELLHYQAPELRMMLA